MRLILLIVVLVAANLGFSARGDSIPTDQFKIKILNVELVETVVKTGRQYIRNGSPLFLTTGIEGLERDSVSCRFDWESSRKVEIPSELTAVSRLDFSSPKGQFLFYQTGFGFKEEPLIIACNKLGLAPIRFEEVLASLKGVIEYLP